MELSLCVCLVGFLVVATPAKSQTVTISIYQTGYENPPFTAGPLAGQDGWNVFGTSDAATVQSAVFKSGSQATAVDASLASGQTGPFRFAPFDTSSSPNKVVTIEADVYLASSSTQGSWQFAAITPSGFTAGFNPLIDGRLQLITPGFTQTEVVIIRDTWMHYTLSLDYATQTFDVMINGSPVAIGFAFLTSQAQFGGFIFDTFHDIAGENDEGFLDNLSIEATPLTPQVAIGLVMSQIQGLLDGGVLTRGQGEGLDEQVERRHCQPEQGTGRGRVQQTWCVRQSGECLHQGRESDARTRASLV